MGRNGSDLVLSSISAAHTIGQTDAECSAIVASRSRAAHKAAMLSTAMALHAGKVSDSLQSRKKLALRFGATKLAFYIDTKGDLWTASPASVFSRSGKPPKSGSPLDVEFVSP